MSAESPALITKPPQIKIVISGEKMAGKSVLAQLIAGHLKLLGHDAFVVERHGGDKFIVNQPEQAKHFRDKREIKIEVKPA
jgi:hypothetical protein